MRRSWRAWWAGLIGRAHVWTPVTNLSPMPFFFFNDTATTEIYTLSLHDALPIWKSDGPRPELDADKVEVVVPFPLTQAQHERLSTIFSSRMGRPVNIHETIDAEIVAGMVVRVENVVLDGSLKTKVKGMLGYVRENLSP